MFFLHATLFSEKKCWALGKQLIFLAVMKKIFVSSNFQLVFNINKAFIGYFIYEYVVREYLKYDFISS